MKRISMMMALLGPIEALVDYIRVSGMVKRKI